MWEVLWTKVQFRHEEIQLLVQKIVTIACRLDVILGNVFLVRSSLLVRLLTCACPCIFLTLCPAVVCTGLNFFDQFIKPVKIFRLVTTHYWSTVARVVPLSLPFFESLHLHVWMIPQTRYHLCHTACVVLLFRSAISNFFSNIVRKNVKSVVTL